MVPQLHGTLTFVACSTGSPATGPPSCHAILPASACRSPRPQRQQKQQQSEISFTSTVSGFCFSRSSPSGRIEFGHGWANGGSLWLSKGESSAAVLEFETAASDWRASIFEDESANCLSPEVLRDSADEKPNPNRTDSLQTVNGVEAQVVSIAEQKSEPLDGANSGNGSTQKDKCREILRLFKNRKTEEALRLLDSVSGLDEWVISIYEQLLLDCSKYKAVSEAKELHALALKHKYLSNLFIGSSFVSAYSKLGMIRDAQQVFDGMPVRNSVSWNAFISGCAKYGSHEKAAKLYHSMKLEGFQLSEIAFVLMLNSCGNNGDIHIGKQIHADARDCGYDSKVLVGTALVNMYAKCGDLENARQVFDSMPERSVVSWNAIISGYVKTGKGREALNLYQQMKKADLRLTDFTFIFLLKACGSLVDIEQGKQIHADIIESGIAFNVFLGTALVDMYAKCGDVGKAQEIFDKMPSRNEVSFAALISGYSKNRKNKEAIRCYLQMREEGFKPHAMTLVSVLHACSLTEALEEGRQIHADVVKCGFELDVLVTTALVDMYCKCHRLPLAREVFDKMPRRTVVSYTAVIAAYAKNAAGDEALRLYDQMKKDGIKPDFMTFVFALNACASTGNLEMGKRTHAEILEAGLESHVRVGSALVDMYSKCGSLTDSRQVFDKIPTRNEYTWTSMIAGYAKHGDFEEAFRLYRQMKLQDLKPDVWTFVCVLNVCAQIGSLEYGKEVHEDIHKGGYETDATVSKSLTIMYSKCGSPETAQAQKVLQEV